MIVFTKLIVLVYYYIETVPPLRQMYCKRSRVGYMLEKLFMKRAANNDTNVLKGVSTLDAFFNKALLIVLSSPLIFLFFLFSTVLYAAPGHSTLDLVDPTFDPEIHTGSYNPKTVRDIISLPDGKILVGGVFNSYNGIRTGTLIRLNPDGSIDSTFNNQTLTTTSGIENNVNQMILQSDGKIIVRLGNSNIAVNDNEPEDIIRLNADGTIDPSFNYNGDAFAEPFISFERSENFKDESSFEENFAVNASDFVTIDANDRLVFIHGAFPALRRLNTDGSPDTSAQFPATSGLHTIAAQGNKIITSGSPGNGNQITVQRFNEDGSLDTTFNETILTHSVFKFIVQPDKKIILMAANGLRRLNEDGTEDSNFTRTTQSNPKDIYLTNSGKIILLTQPSSNQISRFLSNGAPDTTFNTYSFPNAPYQLVSTIAANLDDGVFIGDQIIGINSPQIPNGFSKLKPDGSLDTTFNIGGNGFQSVVPGKIRSIVVQKDEKIIIGGSFDSVNHTPQYKVARLNADSTIDTSFQINSGVLGNTFTRILSVYKIALQTDGKLVVSGNFDYKVNGLDKSNLVRLNTDGSIDPSFELGVTLIDTFGCCGGGKNITVPLASGKMIVGKSRLSANESIPIKLNSDGSLDSSFNSNIFSGQNVVYIWGLVVQTDGKIIIGGNHSGANSSKSFVARLNMDGGIDATFQINEQANRFVSDLALLPNGKVLVAIGDRYSNIPSPQQSDVLRLNTDGTIDTSFDAGASADGRINAIIPLGSGRIFVGGDFAAFDGQTRQNLAQLNADGSLIPVNYSVNAEVYSLASDGIGRLLVGGNFTEIGAGNGGNANRSHIARIIDSQRATNTRLDFDGDGIADLGVFDSRTGIWNIFNSGTNQTTSTQFGLSEDITVPADFDGDGKTDIAIYRPSEGNWYLNQSTDGFAVIRWGLAEDIPLPADFDKDGRADIVVWRPSTGIWYIYNTSDSSISIIKFGLNGDIPLEAADFDGDGQTDIAVWRPSDGNFYWLESGSKNRFRVVHFGQMGDIPAVGDYNGDGKTDLVVFRPNNGVWYQLLTAQNDEYTFSAKLFGNNTDEPVAADYDGDGRTDIAFRRENTWHILMSAQGYSKSIFGNKDSVAVGALANPYRLNKKQKILPKKILQYRRPTKFQETFNLRH